ncbi:MAG: AAA family ATPase [Chloroflexota bacterium]
MDGARTRGQPAAVSAVAAMIRGRPPHAVLLVGPPGVGKTTLALDLAAGLLCTDPAVADRPCRACRACRLVEHGNHPDLHRLGPEGPGRQILIGRGSGEARGIRDLIADLALLPVEGGARVAIVEHAERMNEDAQSALLKTLEEPPSGVTIVLCSDDEDLLLPTVRSRCARIRLGPVASREVEAILVERAGVDAPTAARAARLGAGRPGLALAYARSPEALAIRGELVRGLLDLVPARSAVRLAAARQMVPRAAELAELLERPPADDREAGAAPGRRSGRGRSTATPAPAVATAPARSAESDGDATADGPADPVADPRAPATERRRAVATLASLWSELTRDAALVAAGDRRAIHDPALLEELDDATAVVAADRWPVFLGRLIRAGELLESNVSPELVLDSLVLAWARPVATHR